MKIKSKGYAKQQLREQEGVLLERSTLIYGNIPVLSVDKPLNMENATIRYYYVEGSRIAKSPVKPLVIADRRLNLSKSGYEIGQVRFDADNFVIHRSRINVLNSLVHWANV